MEEQNMSDNEGWTVYVSKGKKKFNKWKENKEKNSNYKDSLKVELKFDRDSWQYKLVKDKYVFSDGTSVLKKYELSHLLDEFKQCKNNYKRNKVYDKLTDKVTDDEWEKIKNDVVLRQL